MSNPSPAAAVRERFKARREAMRRTIEIPFVVDQELADQAERLAREYEQAKERLERFLEVAEEDDDQPGDVRADGTAVEPSLIDQLQRAVDSTHAELEEVIEAVREGSARVIFRLATATEYQDALTKVEREMGKSVDTTNEAVVAFGDELLRITFLRVEHDGEDLGYESWAEFADDMQLTFGDVEGIRTPVVAKNRSTGAFRLPFSLQR